MSTLEPMSQPSESPAPAASDAAPGSGDVGDDEFEHSLEEAEQAVEHQASYGSPSVDDLAPDSFDGSSEPEVTGSAPQEGQSEE